jgi:protein-S-isoprenylcysteine O-methyltransferase Ste14
MLKRLVTAVFTIGSTLGYLWLSVLGAGGLDAFRAHPQSVALAGITLVLATLAIFTEGNISSGKREDRSNRWILPVIIVIGLINGYLPAYTDRIEFWCIDGDTARWLGVLVYTVGGAVRMWPVFVLGRRFSGLVAIQPGHTLLTTGIYRVIRHPSYLGLLLGSFGWALGFRSALGVLLAVFIIPPLLARIKSEEALLRSEFGAEYEAFCAQTPWRLIPGLF